MTKLKRSGLRRLHDTMDKALTHGDLAYLTDQEMDVFQIAAKRWNYLVTVEQQKRQKNKFG